MTETMREKQGEAADAARAVGSTAKERATDVASTAGDEAKAVAHDAKDQAREVVQRSREQLRTEASQQTDRLATTLTDVGDQLRAMSRGDAQPSGTVASLTSQLADKVSSTADRLRDGGYDSAVSDIKRMARNRPGMFLLGALGAGFVVGRVVKAIDTGALMEAAKSDESSQMHGDARIGAGEMSSSFEGSYVGASFEGETAPYEPFEQPPATGVTGSSRPASSLPPPPASAGATLPPEVP